MSISNTSSRSTGRKLAFCIVLRSLGLALYTGPISKRDGFRRHTSRFHSSQLEKLW